MSAFDIEFDVGKYIITINIIGAFFFLIAVFGLLVVFITTWRLHAECDSKNMVLVVRQDTDRYVCVKEKYLISE